MRRVPLASAERKPLLGNKALTPFSSLLFSLSQLDDEADFLFDDSDEYAAFLADLQAPWDALPVRLSLYAPPIGDRQY